MKESVDQIDERIVFQFLSHITKNGLEHFSLVDIKRVQQLEKWIQLDLLWPFIRIYEVKVRFGEVV